MRPMTIMDGQDWTQVVVRGKQTRPAAAVVKPQVSATVAQARRLESDEPPKPKSLSHDSKQAIITTRVAKGWNQTQLNTQCAFPQHTIRDIENGKLTPTPAQLNVLNRVLKLLLKFA
jgi:ribosome-binding protein aMBF1 (putative translation factor)